MSVSVCVCVRARARVCVLFLTERTYFSYNFVRRIQDFEQQQKKLERGRSGGGATGALQSGSSNRSSRDMLDTVCYHSDLHHRGLFVIHHYDLGFLDAENTKFCFQAGASEIPPNNRQYGTGTDDDVSTETEERPKFSVGPVDRVRASSGADATLPCQLGEYRDKPIVMLVFSLEAFHTDRVKLFLVVYHRFSVNATLDFLRTHSRLSYIDGLQLFFCSVHTD